MPKQKLETGELHHLTTTKLAKYPKKCKNALRWHRMNVPKEYTFTRKTLVAQSQFKPPLVMHFLWALGEGCGLSCCMFAPCCSD